VYLCVGKAKRGLNLVCVCCCFFAALPGHALPRVGPAPSPENSADALRDIFKGDAEPAALPAPPLACMGFTKAFWLLVARSGLLLPRLGSARATGCCRLALVAAGVGLPPALSLRAYAIPRHSSAAASTTPALVPKKVALPLCDSSAEEEAMPAPASRTCCAGVTVALSAPVAAAAAVAVKKASWEEGEGCVAAGSKVAVGLRVAVGLPLPA
jgi:hypothetical protein